ncbi:hypothetical protein [Pseudofulvibacter geojedonensis]|uniref:HNH endonuclease n=1 Tax=Pseudofulvibacter geojedonensis TaxID=1123758 RepID=A0ABW3I2Y0_9FLAO
MTRKETDTCLLCKSRESTKTNSHWIPASMLKSMVGKRNYEESYNITNAPSERIEAYYGRSNLKNTDPELKEHHYALDYIFCPICEDNLGKIEGNVVPIIQNEIRLTNKAANYSEKVSLLKIPYKECDRLSNARFKILIYSLIWRISIIYKLQYGQEIISEDILEELREILHEFLPLELTEIDRRNEEIKNFDFQVITADYFVNSSRNLVYTEKIYSNPSLFYFSEFIVLFYSEGYSIDPNNQYHLPIKSIIEFPEILNESGNSPKIGFITPDHFDNLCKVVLIEAAESLMNNLTKEVVDCSGNSYIESRRLIHQIGLDIHRRTGNLISSCYYDASRIICEGLD